MRNIFFYADPHFSHAGVTKFLRHDGTKLRPWDNVEEMDEALVQKYNERVGPKDKCYFLGDIVMRGKYLPIVGRLNGDKVLIPGNHDLEDAKKYLKYFRDIRAYHVMKGLIFSHIPIHEDSLGRFGCNVHGHLHANRVMYINHKQWIEKQTVYQGHALEHQIDTLRSSNDWEPDPRYYCVSVECINFAPISLEELRQAIERQGGDIEMKDKY